VRDRTGQVWGSDGRLFLVVKPGERRGAYACHYALLLDGGEEPPLWWVSELVERPFEESDGWERLA